MAPGGHVLFLVDARCQTRGGGVVEVDVSQLSHKGLNLTLILLLLLGQPTVSLDPCPPQARLKVNNQTVLLVHLHL